MGETKIHAQHKNNPFEALRRRTGRKSKERTYDGKKGQGRSNSTESKPASGGAR